MRRRIAPLSLLLLPTLALADDRQFTFMDMAKVTTPGTFEFEQWGTWQTRHTDDGRVDNFIMKEELEIGVSDRLMFGLDVPEWHFTSAPGDERTGPRLDTVGGEFRYLLLNPRTDPIGLGIKGEGEVGPSTTGLEVRLIVQKNFDRLTLDYNIRLEAEWAKDKGDIERHHDGDLVQDLGASFEFNPNWFAGAEADWDIPMPDWHTGAHQELFLGPNLSYHANFVNGRNWALTVTPMFRATGGSDTPAFQLRAIFECDF
jgi:hypothetical protein